MSSKVILCISLVFSFPLRSMEQYFEEKPKAVSLRDVERDNSLGTLAVLPDETIEYCFQKAIEPYSCKKAVYILSPCVLTSKKCRDLARCALKPKLTAALQKELMKCDSLIDWKKVDNLAQYGADINVKNNRGDFLLLKAVQWKAKDNVKMLLKYHADVNNKGITGRTPLIEAVYYNFVSIVELLLTDEKNEINTQDSAGFSALILAAAKGHDACVEILLKKGAKVNLKNKFNDTAMDHAKRKGDDSSIRLLEAYTKVNFE